MIDFHCHIDLFPDPAAVLQGIEARGMYVLAVTTTPKAWQGTRRVVANCPKVQVAVGLHPELVPERDTEIALLEHFIAETRYVGEIGLDGSPHMRGSFERQEIVLRRALKKCAQTGGRVLSMHSRAAATGVLDALSEEPRAGLPVLHWFSGSLRELERAIALGCWFSVGPAMLRTARGRTLVEVMPADRILTETDSPFTRRKGAEPFMPWDVEQAEQQLGEIWSEPDRASVRQCLLANLRKLAQRAQSFSINPQTESMDTQRFTA